MHLYIFRSEPPHLSFHCAHSLALCGLVYFSVGNFVYIVKKEMLQLKHVKWIYLASVRIFFYTKASNAGNLHVGYHCYQTLACGHFKNQITLMTLHDQERIFATHRTRSILLSHRIFFRFLIQPARRKIFRKIEAQINISWRLAVAAQRRDSIRHPRSS